MTPDEPRNQIDRMTQEILDLYAERDAKSAEIVEKTKELAAILDKAVADHLSQMNST